MTSKTNSALILLFFFGVLMTSQNSVAQQARIAIDGVKMYLLPSTAQPALAALAKGDTIRVIGQRGDWVKVETRDGTKGWLQLPPSGERMVRKKPVPGLPVLASSNDISAQRPGNDQIKPAIVRRKNDRYRRFGYTFGIGMLETDFTYNWKFIFQQTPRLALEGSFKHALGSAASSYLMMANLSYLLAQGRDLLPFVTGGVGVINTVPERSVDSRGVSHMALNYGVGVRKHLKRRMSLLVNLSQYTVFVGKGMSNFREFTIGFLVGKFWE